MAASAARIDKFSVRLIVGLLVGLILRNEYSDWAARLAAVMVRAAARCHPDRERVREECLRHLESIQADESPATGLVYAASIFIRFCLQGGLYILEIRMLFLVAFLAIASRPSWVVWVTVAFVWNAIETAHDRRLLGRLPQDRTLIKQIEMELRYKTNLIYAIAVGYFVLGGVVGGNPIRAGAISALWICLCILPFRSPGWRAFLRRWDQRRFDLIDPRKPSLE